MIRAYAGEIQETSATDGADDEVVDNLVENAIEHNDDPDPRVSLRVEAGAETTRLTVSDNGPGVPAGERPSAFRASDDTDGGGLRIAVTLVERYGGDL